MFNDPNLTINRGGQTLPPMAQGQPPINSPQSEAGNAPPPITQGQPPNPRRHEGLKAKKARGEQLTPKEEAELSGYEGQKLQEQQGLPQNLSPAGFQSATGNEALLPTNNQSIGLGSQQVRQNQIAQQAQRQQYLQSLPPAQRAALMQRAKQAQIQQQNKLVNSFTPDTIQSLMGLINNPNRNVNANLQEQLPQLRDGAGNISGKPSRQRLASVV